MNYPEHRNNAAVRTCAPASIGRGEFVQRHGTYLHILLILLCITPLSPALSQAIALGSAHPQAVSLSPKAWAEEVANNEIKIIQYEKSYLRYRIHTIDSKGDQVRDVIESKDGTVARLLYKDNRPLTPQEDADEHSRLQAMLDSPAAFARHIKNDASGKKLAVDLIRLMPQAMLFTYASGQPQRPRSPTSANAPEIVLDFEPDPNWNPPTMTSEALTGLKGRLWLDPATHVLTRLQGTIFKQVNVGLGVFAHIFPGGQVTFDQVQVLPDRWLFSHFVEHVTVRALMFKTISEDMDLQTSNYGKVNEMNYRGAIHLLLEQPAPTH